MKNIFQMVKEFNDKIIKININTDMSINRYLWFRGVIEEELDEFSIARAAMNRTGSLKSRVDMLDAIVDLIYFAIGRVYELGFTENEFYKHFEFVHNANMNKVKGNKGRGSDEDAIKLSDWVGPEENMIRYMRSKKND